jgi:hypothetical protein
MRSGYLHVVTVAGVLAFTLAGTGSAQAATSTVPSAPSNVAEQPGYDAALVMWTVPANGGTSITGFRIDTFNGTTRVGQTNLTAGAVGSPLDPTPGANDWYNVGLTGGLRVSFKVVAINADGDSQPSTRTYPRAPSSVPTAPYSPPRVSVDTSVQFTATVHWIVPPNNGSPISSFYVEVVNNQGMQDRTVQAGAVGSSLDPTPGATDSLTFTDLVPASESADVQAINSVGDGPAGSTSFHVTGPYFSTGNTQLSLGDSTLGDYVGPQVVDLESSGTTADEVTNITFSGPGANDYGANESCGSVAPDGNCNIDVYFSPGALGSRPATMTITDQSFNSIQISLTGTGTTGYYLFGLAGEVAAFGDAGYYGDLGSITLNRPIVGMSPTGNDGGYWLDASDGGVFAFGDARFFGSVPGVLQPGQVLNQPIVGMATTLGGGGYWMVAADGGVFSFGDAQFHGSVPGVLKPGQSLNKPIVGMAKTPDGKGYWMVASDGGIFSFGDAAFHGSTGGITLNKPIVGMAPTPDGKGYWLVASDGGIFAFGDARYYGSTGGQATAGSIVGMSPMADGLGYWLASSEGAVYPFGDAPNYGSVAGQGVTDAIGIATDSPPTVQAINDQPADLHDLFLRAPRSMASTSAEQSHLHQW